MFGRKLSGAVVCRSCGRLVGADETVCPNCGARFPALFGFAPLLRKLGQDLGFTELVIGACGLLYLAALVVDPAGLQGMRGGVFGLLSPSRDSLLRFGASGAWPVLVADRWWTVLSAGWLHGGLLHIVFNLMWLRQLAPAVAAFYGAARLVLIYTVASVAGFLLSSFVVLVPLLRFLLGARGGISVGSSAAIFGLLGALIHYGKRGGASALSSQVWGWALGLFVLGYLLPGVDNAAHLGGFLGGWLLSRWLDPLKPERIDHVVGALLCLAATAAAVVASLLVPLPPLP
jgi:rhomboid protease GluP